MFHHTPLRYPGGKRRLYGVVQRLIECNGLRDVQYVEAFAGGAAVGIGLLFDEYAAAIHLNDLCPSVYAFWSTLLDNTAWLCKRIERAKLTMPEWRRQREIYRRRESADLDELGFAALYLNRTNRSGIIRGGVIGGQQQNGEWGMAVRFNKDTLIRRIKKIARYRDRIKLYQMDGRDFTNQILPKLHNAFVFYDPPYIERSRLLYLNTYHLLDHKKLAGSIRKLRHPWIVTYDRPAIKYNLFPKTRRVVYGLYYMTQKKREGEEVMFVSNQLDVPKLPDLFGERFTVLYQHTRIRSRART